MKQLCEAKRSVSLFISPSPSPHQAAWSHAASRVTWPHVRRHVTAQQPPPRLHCVMSAMITVRLMTNPLLHPSHYFLPTITTIIPAPAGTVTDVSPLLAACQCWAEQFLATAAPIITSYSPRLQQLAPSCSCDWGL